MQVGVVKDLGTKEADIQRGGLDLWKDCGMRREIIAMIGNQILYVMVVTTASLINWSIVNCSLGNVTFISTNSTNSRSSIQV